MRNYDVWSISVWILEEWGKMIGMIDEIFKVMKHFDGSYINSCGELILSDRGNVYFTATNCETKDFVRITNEFQARFPYHQKVLSFHYFV